MRRDILARNEISNLMEPNPGKNWNLRAHFTFCCAELDLHKVSYLIDPYIYIISDIPNEIDNYHSLYLLEPLAIHQKLPLPSSTYKATHNSTGFKYCLRRLHGTKIAIILLLLMIKTILLIKSCAHVLVQSFSGFRLQSTKCMPIVDLWKKFHHSNVVQLRELFTTKQFGDHCKHCHPIHIVHKPVSYF